MWDMVCEKSKGQLLLAVTNMLGEQSNITVSDSGTHCNISPYSTYCKVKNGGLGRGCGGST